MALERADLYIAMAARILAGDSQVSDGERATAYAGLAQAEALCSIGALLERIAGDPATTGAEFTEAEESLGLSTAKFIHQMARRFAGYEDPA